MKGALSITNYNDGSGSLNEIKVADKLQATGAISIVNKETDINVAQGSEIISTNNSVTLDSAKNVSITGIVNASADTSITASGAMINNKTKRVPLGEVAGKLKMVDPDSQMIKEAKRTGISFGD